MLPEEKMEVRAQIIRTIKYSGRCLTDWKRRRPAQKFTPPAAPLARYFSGI